MERNIERLTAAVELLRHMMEGEANDPNPYVSLNDLNYVLIVAGQNPVSEKCDKEVKVIDTLRSEG